MKNNKDNHEMNRRQFLSRLGLGSATAFSLLTINASTLRFKREDGETIQAAAENGAMTLARRFRCSASA